MKIILAGPPQSGKSCLRYGLREALKSKDVEYPYVITACPDGEGAWFQETYCNNEQLANTLKADYKGKFTDDKIALWSSWVTECTTSLCIVDIGGKIDISNDEICKHATHAILIAGDLSQLSEWREFCMKLHLHIIAEIHSDIDACEDKLLSEDDDGIYRGSIHQLKREDHTLPARPTITKLAEIITALQPQKTTTTRGTNAMGIYSITAENNKKLVLKMGRVAAQNDTLVQEVTQQLEQLITDKEITGGELIKINGPSSLPIAYVLAHKLCHLYQAVAVFDPKLSKYVVSITHSANYPLGTLLDEG